MVSLKLRQVVQTLLIVTICLSAQLELSACTGDDIFQYIKGPVPELFTVGDHYPSRNETEECRPIRVRIARNSNLFRTNLVVNTNNAGLQFASSDARIMTSRLQTRLNRLAESYSSLYGGHITVLQSWVEYSDNNGLEDPYSLHYEGRTVRVSVPEGRYSDLLQLAVRVGFDWVFYADETFARMSVIPDVCDADLDLVFMLDQSGSVGVHNHNIALNFLKDVVSFYDISNNGTQVGLITYSSGAAVQFPLDQHTDIASLQSALDQVIYTGGWTTTALALALAQRVLTPSRGYGARPLTSGVPRIAVLITDGRSNIYSIRNVAPSLRNAGVQVYAVGIGNIYLDELRFIASDPDINHVYLLSSFNDAPDFVDFLSITACDAPAIVTPGENTTTEVAEDGFRFFQSECPAFSETIMIEQIDLVGTCSLYASTTVTNPGPLSPHGVVRNEIHGGTRRSVHVQRTDQNRFIYWSVRGLEARNLFSVIIWDMIFPRDSYTVTIPTGVSGATVFNLNDALRMTNVSFVYSIQSGDDSGLFAVVSDMIVTAAPLSPSVHSLTVLAQNVNHSCHRARVIIHVIARDSTLQFPPLDPVSLLEDSDLGDIVTTVAVQGGDDTVTYSITSGNSNVFSIDPVSGVIQLSELVDFEDIDQYVVTILAVQSSTGARASANLIVNIVDVNEPPFFITDCAVLNNCEFELNELTPPNTRVTTLVAGDPDNVGAQNGELSFSIVGDVPFQLVQSGRSVVMVTSSLVPAGLFSFDLLVSDVSFSVGTRVVVRVLDVNNNPPVFANFPTVLLVDESVDIGVMVTQYMATDADAGPNAVIVYSISSNVSPLPFEINPQNGSLTVTQPLDFETEPMFYTITVTASNPDGLQNVSMDTSIVLVDINDNVPVFDDPVYLASVEEHSDSGTPVVSLAASDQDTGQNSLLDFSIVAGNFEEAFRIRSVTPTSALISVSNPDINREEVQSYNLTVAVSDQGTPSLTSTVQVLITVTDINDNPPIFLPDNYSIMLPEDVTTPFDILTVFVFDLDQPSSLNTQVDFEITDGNTDGVFAIQKTNNNTAVLQLIGPLSFETTPTYTLILTATDRGVNPGPQSSTATVNVAVQNTITTPPVVVTGNLSINVSDTTDVGTALAIINATDADGDALTFSIVAVTAEGVGGSAALGVFNIDNQGVVRLAQRLDNALSNEFEIKIQVTDGLLQTTTILLVRVVNGNRFPPNITSSGFSLIEELPAGSVVGALQAIDLDAEPNENISFTLLGIGRAAELFNVETETGVIRTSQVLDREALVLSGRFLPENNSTEPITILATDEGIPRLSATAVVMVTLLDVNDNAPMFNSISNATVGQVVEQSPGNPVILNAAASDPDLGAAGTVSYSLELFNQTDSATPLFVISSDGIVTATGPLDREEQDSYSVLIRASDQGSPSLSTVLVLDITVVDINDNPPMFSQDVYTVSVLESAPPPQVLLSVSALDPDLGPHAEIRYSILEPTNLFSIDEDGQIILEGALDFETTPTHNLTISAQDRGTPPLSALATVVITVQNVDETPPFFPIPCTRLISEGRSLGLVTNCIAIDIDDTLPGVQTRPVNNYALLDGNIGGAFAISNTGTVSLIAELDREIVDFYSIQVQATDAAGLSTITLLNITVTDVNDNPPIFNNLPTTVPISVVTIQSGSREVLRVDASDADIGVNALLEYSIDSVPSDLVANITVTASDGGSPSNSATSHLIVSYEQNCSIQQYIVNSTSGLITSSLLCGIDLTPPQSAVVINTDLTLTCSALSNVPVSVTWLHNGTAILNQEDLAPGDTAQLTINNVGFQNAGEYTCRASNDAGSLLSMPATVSVQVPATITIPPLDAIDIAVGRTVSFRCLSAGVPAPTTTWSRVNPDGSLSVLTRTVRILPIGQFLTISSVMASDDGVYQCTASNPAGDAIASARLVVFSQSNVVVMPLTEFPSAPSGRGRRSTPAATGGQCHHFNDTEFESVMMSITGVRTLVTSVTGEDVCNQSACSPSPCLNGGSCDLLPDDPTGLSYSCSCPLGFTGPNCETDINECNEAPCLSGGSCTNTPGSFTCHCAAPATGHRCQYSRVCEESTPCPADQLCVTTVANNLGYVCTDQSSEGLQVTLGSASPGMLDDHVNNLMEIQQESLLSQRQEGDISVDLDNDFVTVCEARFIATNSGRYQLRWVCPVGVVPPTGSDLEDICNMLFTSGLILSCETPSGLNRMSVPVEPLPPTTVFVSFILVPADSAPLSARDALALLSRRGTLEQLRGRGYQAVNFTAAVPFDEPVLTESDVIVVGVVVGVVTALIIATLIICVLVCCVRSRKAKKQATSMTVLDNSYSLNTLYTLDSTHQELHPPPVEHTFTFTPAPRTNPPPPVQEPLFDNEDYSRGYVPPALVRGSGEQSAAGGNKRRRSSLKRSSVILRGTSFKRQQQQRDDYRDSLLDSDYDTLEPVDQTPPTKPAEIRADGQSPGEEVIYSNMQYTGRGRHGNAGQRWESYWQSHTLLRTAQQ